MDNTPGERTFGEITKRRREADKMILICSADSLVRDGVSKEIEAQLDEAPDSIIPISRDTLWKHTGLGVKRAMRELKPFLMDNNYANFESDDQYDESLQRVLSALERPRPSE